MRNTSLYEVKSVTRGLFKFSPYGFEKAHLHPMTRCFYGTGVVRVGNVPRSRGLNGSQWFEELDVGVQPYANETIEQKVIRIYYINGV